MQTRWDLGDAVRVVRNVRNDGTYPGKETGDFLVRRGSIGYVKDVGTFLQDQIIYSVHFLDAGMVVGCREEELIDVEDDWVESRFETREIVQSALSLSVQGEIVVPLGSRGEILNIDRPDAEDSAQDLLYYVHFDCHAGKPLMVPERALKPIKPDSA